MGCDIHCCKETLIDGQWVSQNSKSPGESWDKEKEEWVDNGELRLDTINTGRNYAVFGVLNRGVRWECQQSFPYTAELPEDVSVEVKAESDLWDSNGHSHGTRTLQQLNEKLLELTLNPVTSGSEQDYLMAGLRHFMDQIFTSEDHPEKTRVVFWFDN